MQPETLFGLHREKAERLAERLCYHYSVSGALQHLEDMKSEACISLWKRCNTYDPQRQVMQRRKDCFSIKRVFWSLVLHGCPPCATDDELYSTFWINSVQYVRGAVIDYLRSRKLITRLPRNTLPLLCAGCRLEWDGKTKKRCEFGGHCHAPRTMLYHERFLSASGTVEDSGDGNSGTITYLDMLPSADRADSRDALSETRYRILQVASQSDLTEQELRVVTLFCSQQDIARKDVAEAMAKSSAWVSNTLKAAATKMLLVDKYLAF